MVIVVIVGSIHAAIADEASDAVQVLLKLWGANLEASNNVCGGFKILKNEFVGDSKIYKMRRVVRLEDGKVDDAIDETPFRLLEEDVSPGIVPCWYPRSLSWLGARVPPSVVGVKCLFGRDCMNTTTLTYDPIYNPNAQPKMSKRVGNPADRSPVLDPFSYGSVDPANVDRVRRALQTLLRLNASPAFEPPKAPR